MSNNENVSKNESSAKPAKPKRIKPKEIARLLQLQRDASALEKRARGMRDEAAKIQTAVEADLKSTGRNSVNRGQYTILWDEKPGRVSWKNEFIRVAADQVAKIKAPVKKFARIVAPELDDTLT